MLVKDLSFLLDFFVLSLAAWRLSYMLVHEDGNMSLTYAIRLIGLKPKTEGVSRFLAWKRSLTDNAAKTPVKVVSNFGKMLTCIWCTSVTVGILYFLAYSFFATHIVFQVVTFGLAISAFSLIIHDFKFSQ